MRKPNKNADWKTNCRITKTVLNITFNFPSNGFAFDFRDSIINECFNAIKHDLSIIHQNEYTDTITAQFVSSRELGPPIKYEFMHMITIGLWGQPPQESDWLKEGIAAYAENSCNGFTVEQIYASLKRKTC